MKQIGIRLKELRDAKGWTQDDLAEASGMNRVTIAKYEAGRSEPKSASLGKLAMALGVDAGVILGLDEDGIADKPAHELTDDEMIKCFGFSAPLLAIYCLIWQCPTGVFWWASARRLG